MMTSLRPPKRERTGDGDPDNKDGNKEHEFCESRPAVGTHAEILFDKAHRSRNSFVPKPGAWKVRSPKNSGRVAICKGLRGPVSGGSPRLTGGALLWQ
jgi:hypothetical protein